MNRLLVQRWNYPIEIKDKVSNIPENDYLKSVRFTRVSRMCLNTSLERGF